MKKCKVVFLVLLLLGIIWFLSSVLKLVAVQENILNLFPEQNKYLKVEAMKTSNVKLNPKDQSSKDYSQLVNLTNFQFLYLAKCTKNGKYPNLLIAVHTDPANVEKRRAIRETWGKQRAETVLVFMMGLPKTQQQINIVAAEHKKFKDIVQGNFMDGYKNLTYKHVMVLKYAVYHCPEINYLLKTDDDVFVNMPVLLSFIENYNNDVDIAKPRELLYCVPLLRSPAIRDKQKWQVTHDEFAGKYYPPYCLGFAELLTADTALRLYQASQISFFFWIDDVFVTGIAREAAKIKITPVPNSFCLKNKEMKTLIKIKNAYPNLNFPFLLGPVNIDAKGIRNLWKIVPH